TKTSTTTMPRDQWVCLEWEVQLGANGTTALQVNGQAATNLGGTQNLSVSPAVSELGLALVTTAPNNASVPARDLWFDEVMVNPTAIGCTRKRDFSSSDNPPGGGQRSLRAAVS